MTTGMISSHSFTPFNNDKDDNDDTNDNREEDGDDNCEDNLDDILPGHRPSVLVTSVHQAGCRTTPPSEESSISTRGETHFFIFIKASPRFSHFHNCLLFPWSSRMNPDLLWKQLKEERTNDDEEFDDEKDGNDDMDGDNEGDGDDDGDPPSYWM